jgi:hypothetical protein
MKSPYPSSLFLSSAILSWACVIEAQLHNASIIPGISSTIADWSVF